MDKKWIIRRLKNVKFNNPVMIEGLPGMGNVGKITVDFIIENLKAVKVYEVFSHGFPNCVFVNEKGLAELPKVEIYYKKVNNKDLFLVSGDMQPVNESDCYELCDKLLEIFKESGGKEIVTLGGIGLEEPPKNPKLYCSGTDSNSVKRFLSKEVKSAEGVVGPIIGVSGLLIGLAKVEGLKGIILLVETLGAPNYLGVKEAKELIKVLNKEFKLGLDMIKLSKEVKEIDNEINEQINSILNLREKKLKAKKDFVNYIG